MFNMAAWLGLPLVQKYKGLDMMSLPLNHAYVIVNTTIDDVGLYSVKSDCFQCPYKLVKKLQAHEEVAWEVDTSGEELWKIMNFGDNEYMANYYRGGLICQEKPTFDEFGVYRLEVGACVFKTEVPPIQSYLPLVACGLLMLAIFLIYAAAKRLLECRKIKTMGESVVNFEKCEDKMKSLIYLRGLLMVLIIFTTLGGGGYPWMNKKLGEISVPDIALSALAWTIGVQIPHAVDSEMSNERKKTVVAGNICMRSFVLIILSLAIDSIAMMNHSSNILFSPLKRIGIAYFLAASTYALTAQRFEKHSKSLMWKVVGTMTTLLWGWVLFAVILATLIISMLTFASFNSLENTSFGQQSINRSNIESEVTVGYDNIYSEMANRILVGNKKIILDVNNYIGFSAGLLGKLSTVLYTVIGMKVGVILAHFESQSERMKLCVIWATLIAFIGLVLVTVPLQINVWPIASIFLISAMSTYIHMILSWWNLHQKKSSPISSMGSSYLFILFGHLLFSKCLPFTFDNTLNIHFWCLLQNIWTVALWMILAEILVRRNVKITI